ncbi:hypothetical protein D1872_220020 [compost metagenome]
MIPEGDGGGCITAVHPFRQVGRFPRGQAQRALQLPLHPIGPAGQLLHPPPAVRAHRSHADHPPALGVKTRPRHQVLQHVLHREQQQRQRRFGAAPAFRRKDHRLPNFAVFAVFAVFPVPQGPRPQKIGNRFKRRVPFDNPLVEALLLFFPQPLPGPGLLRPALQQPALRLHHRPDNVFGLTRLQQVIANSLPQRLLGIREIPIARQNDHFQTGSQFPGFLRQLQPAFPFHADIRHQNLRLLLRNPGQLLLRGGGRRQQRQAQLFPGDHAGQPRPDDHFIVHNHDFHGASSHRGIEKATRVPPPSRLSMSSPESGP